MSEDVDERGSPWDSSRVEFESCVVVQLYLKVDLIFPHELFVRTLPVAGVQTCLLCVCVYTHALSLNTQPSAKFYALSSVSTPGTVTTMLGSTSGVVDGLLVRSVPPIPSPAVWSPSTQLLARLESWCQLNFGVARQTWQITFAQFGLGQTPS
jgi:hypothetical protein